MFFLTFMSALIPHSFSLDSDSGIEGDFKAPSILAADQTVLITGIVPQTVILLIIINLPCLGMVHIAIIFFSNLF